MLLFLFVFTLDTQAEPAANQFQYQQVSSDLNGQKLTGFYTWHDETGDAELDDAILAITQKQFAHSTNGGSTGLLSGALWATFGLQNDQTHATTVHIEYVDHQLITQTAYTKRKGDEATWRKISHHYLADSFELRKIAHNRYVYSVSIEPNSSVEVLVRYASDKAGYIFPNPRLWSEQNLRQAQQIEGGFVAFILGGIFLMAVFSLAGGIATGDKSYQAYSVYAFSKVILWSTILGYTHQFFLIDNFHWSYMSISGAVTIFSGLWFSRILLQTKQFTPKLDKLVQFMMVNAMLLLIFALLKLTVFAVITITIALLLYPVLFIAGVVRWRQGSKYAGVYSLAWLFLMAGLMIQALRDLGFVDHNFVNYYWPPFASYTEMLVIMVAMGMRVIELRKGKEEAEHKYLQQLEHSKHELEREVLARTADIENERALAQAEANTDPLTGIHNRRCFLRMAQAYMDKTQEQDKPYSVLMFDIDHFKEINDTYGHNVGDQAIKAFAQAISGDIRDSDVFGRFGGEEFALLLRYNNLHAIEAAERLREKIKNMVIETEQGSFSFTVSVGVAHKVDEQNIDQLLNRADKGLYQAKHQGRDRVVVI